MAIDWSTLAYTRILKYSCLGSPIDRGAWWTSPWGHKEMDITECSLFFFHVRKGACSLKAGHTSFMIFI